MPLKEGWVGRFYEDFEVGDVYRHPLGRTVTTTDNIWFTLLTQNTAPIHFDHHYAAQTEFGKPLVDSTFKLRKAPAKSIGQRKCQVTLKLPAAASYFRRDGVSKGARWCRPWNPVISTIRCALSPRLASSPRRSLVIGATEPMRSSSCGTLEPSDGERH
ncbi:MAG TPA: MaoC family dehydratase [Nitrolancea sp.]|nr:MaoC family dehydratase [Nitrolancea sp.]